MYPRTHFLGFIEGDKKACNIAPGDLIMGSDGQPHRVTNIRQEDTTAMYKVMPDSNDIFMHSIDGKLRLVDAKTNITSYISIKNFLRKPYDWKSRQRLYSMPVEYADKEVKNDPYMVGIVVSDAENKIRGMEDILRIYLSKKLDHLIKFLQDDTSAHLTNMNTAEMNHILNHKFIPDEYLYNSREIRQELLKGIIETSAHIEQLSRAKSRGRSKRPGKLRKICKSKIRLTRNIINTENKILAEQIKFLARSLGFRCVYRYPYITIYGNIKRLPYWQSRIKYKFDLSLIRQISPVLSIVVETDSTKGKLLSSCIVV